MKYDTTHLPRRDDPGFGAALKAAREARHISRTMLALVAGVDPQTVARVELGRTKVGIGTRKQLIDALWPEDAPPQPREKPSVVELVRELESRGYRVMLSPPSDDYCDNEAITMRIDRTDLPGETDRTIVRF